MDKGLTTSQAAKAVGIGINTLNVWIRCRKVEPAPLVVVGSHAQRVWARQDIARLREVKARIYRKGRGRKPRK